MRSHLLLVAVSEDSLGRRCSKGNHGDSDEEQMRSHHDAHPRWPLSADAAWFDDSEGTK